MEKTTLYLPTDLQQSLRLASRRTGRTQAEIVRTALSEHLAPEREGIEGLIGIGEGRTDLCARDSEEWLEREWSRDHPR